MASRLTYSRIDEEDTAFVTNQTTYASQTDLILPHKKLPGLKNLNLMTKLLHLDLSYNIIEDLSFPLPPHLVSLTLEHNRIKSLSLIPQGGRRDSSRSTLPTKSLKVLNLSHNFITSMKGIQLFPNLVKIYLSHNRISQIRSTTLTKLKFLDLSFNRILSVNEVRSLTANRSLRSLKLEGNPVASTRPVELKTTIRSLLTVKNLDGRPLSETHRMMRRSHSGLSTHSSHHHHHSGRQGHSAVDDPFSALPSVLDMVPRGTLPPELAGKVSPPHTPGVRRQQGVRRPRSVSSSRGRQRSTAGVSRQPSEVSKELRVLSGLLRSRGDRSLSTLMYRLADETDKQALSRSKHQHQQFHPYPETPVSASGDTHYHSMVDQHHMPANTMVSTDIDLERLDAVVERERRYLQRDTVSHQHHHQQQQPATSVQSDRHVSFHTAPEPQWSEPTPVVPRQQPTIIPRDRTVISEQQQREQTIVDMPINQRPDHAPLSLSMLEAHSMTPQRSAAARAFFQALADDQ